MDASPASAPRSSASSKCLATWSTIPWTVSRYELRVSGFTAAIYPRPDRDRLTALANFGSPQPESVGASADESHVVLTAAVRPRLRATPGKKIPRPVVRIRLGHTRTSPRAPHPARANTSWERERARRVTPLPQLAYTDRRCRRETAVGRAAARSGRSGATPF